MMHFDTAVLSAAGGREDNEDYCGFRLLGDMMEQGGVGGGCWALADGLGGHSGGAQASRTAVEAVLGFYKTNPISNGDVSAQTLSSQIATANQAVLDKQQNEPELKSMRTTLVVLVSNGVSAAWAHVGDSRLYFFRGGHVAAQTRDHSVPQRLADAGEITPDQIRFHEDRNRLLRSLGAKSDLGTVLLETPVQLAAGDAFLLASDGFWEWVVEAEMEADLAQSDHSSQWASAMERRLHARATPRNDNYSAIAVRVGSLTGPGAGPGESEAKREPTSVLGSLRRWLHGPE